MQETTACAPENKTGIMSEMQRVEDVLKDSSQRVDEIDRKLRTKLLSLDKRERLERELEDVKEVLRRNENRLRTLRKENTKTFLVAASLAFACFLAYSLYCAIYNVR